MPTMHQKGMIRIGGKVIQLAGAGLTEEAMGMALDDALTAGLKAITAGKQSDKQIRELQRKFRQAFARQVTRTLDRNSNASGQV